MKTVNEIKRMKVLGVPVDMVSRTEAIEVFSCLMDKAGCSLIVTPNSEIVESASRNAELKALIESAELIIPDGIGLVYASRILKNPLHERVTGIDFLSAILEYLQSNGKSAYFLGSKPGVAKLAVENMKVKYPGLKIAGERDGYFKADEEKEIVADINESGADFLCVAMGSPRQEQFIYNHIREFSTVRAAMGVGGSLDVWAGTLKRAPTFYQNHGLEWLYRLLQEPSRYKRMLKLPVFMIKVMTSKKDKQIEWRNHMEFKVLEEAARNIRIGIVKSVYAAGSGHPGGSLSAADIVAALYFGEMNVDPKNPKMANRDKFVLSKGHAAPVQYAALAEKGFFPKEDLLGLRKLGNKLQGHPDYKKVPGVEMSTGSLGQGFAVAGGMAMANKLDQSTGRIYALLGDGELQEGIVWEAAMSAAHYRLDNFVAIVDWNGLQIDGNNDDVITVKPIDEKFKSFGWNVLVIDGHDFKQITEAFASARQCKGKPTAIIAKTLKGKGVSFMEDNAGWHGKAPNDDELKQAISELGGEQ